MKRIGSAPMIILVIAAVIILGVIGYFVLRQPVTSRPQSSTQSQQASSTTIVPPIATSSTVTSSTTDVSSWKIYTNQQYDFSFKYPPGWFVQPVPSAVSRLTLILDEPSDEISSNGVTINITSGTIQSATSHLSITDTHQETINAMTWTVISSKGDEGIDFIDFYIQHAGLLFQFGGFDSDQNSNLIPTALSTFNFTSSQ